MALPAGHLVDGESFMGLWSEPKIGVAPSAIRYSNRAGATATEEDRAALKKLEAAADEERRERPGASVEIWAMDEQKPIFRGDLQDRAVGPLSTISPLLADQRFSALATSDRKLSTGVISPDHV
jgi:hypothetical protein